MARSKDQRQSPRQWVTVPVVLQNGGECVDALSINVSDGGMYLFAAANLGIGTQIEISFRLPGEKELVRTWGTVRRRALYLYGIEFLKDHIAAASTRTDIDSHVPESPASANAGLRT